MGLQKCGLNLNRANKELQPHGTFDFPCAGYADRYTDKPDGGIPWHWHEEIEIIYIEQGRLRLQIPAKTFSLERGECIFINSNVFHCAEAEPTCELRSFVFHPLLVMGNTDSIFARKYILPLTSCPSFDGQLLTAAPDYNPADDFIHAFKAFEQDASGFEFTVRSKLSNICFHLYQMFEQHIIANNNTKPTQDNLRIQKMLEYIHNNFENDVSLAEIAKAASIGERECLRCFKKKIQISPMQYLLKYRIMKGAELLSHNPESSVLEIAVSCGFSSQSNFSKMFRRFYSCTPREYRKYKNPA